MNDKKNAIKKLQIAARTIKLNPTLDLKEINLGSPKEYLRLFHYLFLDYSPAIASDILNKHQMELSSKNDKLFIDGIYKLTRDMFGYVPKLTKDQFFQTSFAQIKALMAAEIIELVHEKYKPSVSLSGVTSSSTTNRSVNPATKVLNGLSENNENIDTISPKQVEKEPVQRKASFKNTNQPSLPNLGSQTIVNKSVLKQNSKQFTVLKEHNINNDLQKSDEDLIEEDMNKKHETILNNLFDKIANLTFKFDSILTRVENIENTLANYKLNENLNNQNENRNKNYENILNRLIILETDLISVKQNLYNKSSNDVNNISLRENDPNDTTAYETPFHSFLNVSPKQEEINIYPKKSSIVQGLPCNIENIIADNFHDLTINSTDSTPTLSNPVKESRLSNNSESKNEQDLNILRAKELVNRANHLNQILSSNLKY